MANVAFKRGTEASLKKYLSTYLPGSGDAQAVQAQEGTFYLTTDTNRLYVGKTITASDIAGGASGLGSYIGTIRAVPVNQGALVVKSIADLPPVNAAIPGQFYYTTDENILCIASGNDSGGHVWVQINPNTNDNDFLTEITTTISSNTYTDVYHISNGSDFTSETNEIVGADSFGVEITPRYEAASVYLPGITYYKNTGTAQAPVWVENTNIVSQSTYNAATGANAPYIRKGVKITLTPVTYSIAGSVDGNGNGVITLSNNKNATTSTAKIGAGEKIKDISYDTPSSTILINALDTEVTGLAFSNNTTSGQHGFKLSLTQADNNSNSSTITTTTNYLDPQIIIGKNGNIGNYFVNGVATLPVYTVAEIDNKFSAFNAMHYKGVIADNAIITNAQIGDVYKASEDVTSITYRFQSDPEDSSTITQKTITLNCEQGDLIIFNSSNGTEDATTGYLTTTLVTTDVIPSGDEVDTVTVVDSTNGFIVQNQAGINTPEAVGSYTTVGSAPISVATTVSTTGGYPAYTATVSHNTASVTTTGTAPGSSYEYTGTTAPNDSGYVTIIVPYATFDTYGHVSAIRYGQYEVKDTHATLTNGYAITQVTENSAAVNKIDITNTVGDSDVAGNEASAVFGITSDSIQLTATTTGSGANTKYWASMDIVWGTF